MEITREECFTVRAKDKAGLLARVTSKLLEKDVQMSGLWGFGVGLGSARVLAVPRDVDNFVKVAKEADWQIEHSVCFRIEGEDKPGALVEILDVLASESINLHAVDAMSLDGHFGCYLWAEEEDIETISQLLGLSTPRL